MERDQQFEAFVNAYPASRRQRGYMVQTAFLAALDKVSFETLMQALTQHTQSEQWATGVIPSMEKWLLEERWIQVLPTSERILNRLTPFERARRAGLK
jgi:hypothetical protein